MKTRLLPVIMMALISPLPLLAQRNDIPARIAFKNQSGIVDVLLTGRRGDTLYARLNAEATGSITYNVGDVKRIAINLPGDEFNQAEAKAAAGQSEPALRLLRNAVRPALPYLDLPVDGAVEPAMLYAKVARSEKQWAEASSVYKAMYGNPDSAISQQAAGWLAYCFAKNLQVAEAREWIDLFTEENPVNSGFVPAMLAEAILMAGEARDEEALDFAARASSLARIDHELYPEAMYMSAEAYFRMSQKTVLAPKTAEVVLGKADKVESPPSAMLPEEFLAVATNQFQRVIQFFPTTVYSAQSTEQLKNIQQQLDAAPQPVQPESGDTP